MDRSAHLGDGSPGLVPLEVAAASLAAAEVGWLLAGAALTVFDVWLVRTSRAPLTDAARAHPAVTAGVMALLGLHFADRLGKFDPFTALGRLSRKAGNLVTVG